MSFESHVLMERLAVQLRREIAPAVDDEYQRTQTHMAGVILERLAREAALGERHRVAEAADVARLAAELNDILDVAPTSTTETVPQEVRGAVARLQSDRSVMSLRPLLEALYGWGPDGPVAASVLDAIRQVLRRDIDRRMEIAR